MVLCACMVSSDQFWAQWRDVRWRMLLVRGSSTPPPGNLPGSFTPGTIEGGSNVSLQTNAPWNKRTEAPRRLVQECGIAIRPWAQTTFQEMPIFLCLGKGGSIKASKSQNVLVFAQLLPDWEALWERLQSAAIEISSRASGVGHPENSMGRSRSWKFLKGKGLFRIRLRNLLFLQ